MSTLSATIAVQDDAPSVIAALLRQFPKGRRIRVALTDEGEATPLAPDVESFMERLENARKAAPPCPWQTTDEALHELREGEAD